MGSTPQKIRHVRPKLLCSSSGAVKSLEQGLPLGAKLKHSNLGRTCSIHILKRPFFWLSQPPLIHLHSLQASKQHNAAKSLDTLTQSAGIIKASKCSKIFGYTYTVCRHQGIKTQQNKTNTPKITQARAHLATGFASTRSILVCYQWRAAHSICAAKTAGLGTLCM